jgi:hypothetical protein
VRLGAQISAHERIQNREFITVRQYEVLRGVEMQYHAFLTWHEMDVVVSFTLRPFCSY